LICECGKTSTLLYPVQKKNQPIRSVHMAVMIIDIPVAPPRSLILAALYFYFIFFIRSFSLHCSVRLYEDLYRTAISRGAAKECSTIEAK